MEDFESKISALVHGNLPALPENGKEALVKYLPWIIIVLSGLGLCSVISMGLFASGFLMMGAGFVGMIFLLLVPTALLILSVLGGFLMLKRQLKGWRIVFYSGLLNVAVGILSFHIFGIILSLVGTYLLIQIRESYT